MHKWGFWSKQRSAEPAETVGAQQSISEQKTVQESQALTSVEEKDRDLTQKVRGRPTGEPKAALLRVEAAPAAKGSSRCTVRRLRAYWHPSAAASPRRDRARARSTWPACCTMHPCQPSLWAASCGRFGNTGASPRLGGAMQPPGVSHRGFVPAAERGAGRPWTEAGPAVFASPRQSAHTAATPALVQQHPLGRGALTLRLICASAGPVPTSRIGGVHVLSCHAAGDGAGRRWRPPF